MFELDFQFPRYCLHNIRTYTDIIEKEFRHETVRIIRCGESASLKIRAESQGNCAVIVQKVKKCIRNTNAQHCLKLFNLHETHASHEHHLLDQNSYKNLLFSKVLQRFEADSGSIIIIDRTGAVDIFGPSPAATNKAKQLIDNFTPTGDQTGNGFRNQSLDLQQQQQENVTNRPDNIPNDPLNSVPKTGFGAGSNSTPVNTEFQCIFIDRSAVGMVIGTKGTRKMEFENKFSVRVNILTDRLDTSQDSQVKIEIRGKSSSDVQQAADAILEFVKTSDRRRPAAVGNPQI